MPVVHRRFGFAFVAIVFFLAAVSSACSPVRRGYFAPQTNAAARLPTVPIERPVRVDTLSGPGAETPAGQHVRAAAASEPRTVTEVTHNVRRLPVSHSAGQHRNPESQSVSRVRRLFAAPVAYVAPQQRSAADRNNPARRIHRLAWVALGLSALAYAPFVLTGVSALAWVLSLLLPVTAVLLGAASVTTINRNTDRLRGKGWAVAAIVLGTGVLGLSLAALAALSASNVFREK